MKKADLHVHSRYSEHPSEWFLQRVGAAESYTAPETVYAQAIAQGMDFVTVTDHNCVAGALALQRAHPERVFTGVETTTYFPEDGCKIHILIYGLDEDQFRAIEERRSDIYRLRDYVRDAGLAHSVAHGTYSVNGRLSAAHLEKLILLFDVFEAQNGARDQIHNDGWTQLLRELTPGIIERLRRKHAIEPMSETPWIKGFTGGSDDHAGLFIGKTFTQGHAKTPREFLECVRDKTATAAGSNSNYRALAFSIYKIAYDYAKTKSNGNSPDFLSRISRHVFENDRLGLLGRLRLAQHKRRAESGLERMVAELVENLHAAPDAPIEAKLDMVYGQVARIADKIVRATIESVAESVHDGNLWDLCTSLSLVLPGILLSAPFLSAFRHLHSNKMLLAEVRKGLGMRKARGGKKILWFTDTLTDVNGVAVTLRTLGWTAYREGRNLTLVTSMLPQEMSAEVPPNVINLPASYHCPLPAYDSLQIKVPSVLAGLKELFAHDPDEIFISSPGPVGLLGLLMGRLLGAPCRGLYHTDFTAEAKRMAGDDSVAELVEAYTKWFYSVCRRIEVPSHEYRALLEARGYDREKVRVFPRGINSEVFSPRNGSGRQSLPLATGVTLLYIGRVSKDKSVGFLADIYERARARLVDLNLIVAGDGPDLQELRARFASNPRVVLLGRVAHTRLPDLYSRADLLVFPSVTDTFGLAVLEAQACGLPALVSDVGGPKEIVVDGVTGWVVPHDDAARWADKVVELAQVVQRAPQDFDEIRRRARERVREQFAWSGFVRWVFEEGTEAATEAVRARTQAARPAGAKAASDMRQLALYES